MSTTVIVCRNSRVIAQRAVDLLIDGLRAGVARRGSAHLALTGGSSAERLFDELCSGGRASRVTWERVHVWQGDERFVPWSDERSNWAAARRGWIDHEDGPGIPEAQLHPVPADEAIREGHDAAWAATRYGDAVSAQLPRVGGIPAFDVVLLGVGGDGHILSTFPGTPPLREEVLAAMAVDAPVHVEPHVARVTLSPHLLRAARLILVMVPGAAKAGIIAECFGDLRDPERWPAQLALRPNAVWLLEPGSAAEL